MANPTSQYRVAYLKNRDRLVQACLDRAERARSRGQLADAETAYREALEYERGNERALSGLRQMEVDRRWTAKLDEAQTALHSKDLDTAREKVRAVLVENPRHRRALDLQRLLEMAQERPATETILSEYFKKTVSIEFREAPLKTVFDILSKTSGLNFVFDKDVKSDQKTSIYLRDSSIESALNFLLMTNQLEQRVLNSNTVLIYPSSAAKLRDYQPLTVRSFYLSHAEAKVVAATIKTILKSKDIVVDDKLNLLIVRDSPAAIRLAEKLVALHDVPEPEVMLEVEVLEVSRSKLLDLGVRWPDQLSLTPLSINGGSSLTLADLRHQNSASTGVGIGPLTLNARRQDTDANILANPRIRTRNREKAKILVGERVPNITTTLTSTGFSSDSINYVDVGLKLDVEPTVYPDGEIAIRISLEVSSVLNQVSTKSGSLAYRIGTRSAQTILRLNDGENQVLAGLINDDERKTSYKIPGAGELPVLGRLFGSQADDRTKTEIMLSITPRIVRGLPRPSAAMSEFESGTETGVGQRLTLSATTQGPSNRSTAGLEQAAASRPNGMGSVQDKELPKAPAASLAWLAPPTRLKVGETFSMQLIVQSDAPITDIPLNMGFDPQVFEFVGSSAGDFMRQDGQTPQDRASTDGSGKLSLAVSRSDEVGAKGSGVLHILTMRAIAPSSQTKLEVAPGTASGPGGSSIAVEPPPPLSLVVQP